MSIPETFSFDKGGEVVRFPRFRQYFLTILILLIALLSFGIGRLTAQKREGVTITYPDAQVRPRTSVDSGASDESVYASSRGAKYYKQGCKSAISERNRITFASAALAEAAGYTLAATCKP